MNNLVFKWLQSTGDFDYYIWIGLQDIDNEGQFVYHSTRENASFLNWNSNQPNGGTGQNCAILGYTDSHKGKWFDEPCTIKLPFLCEIPLV